MLWKYEYYVNLRKMADSPQTFTQIISFMVI